MLILLSILTTLLFVLQSLFLKSSRTIGNSGKTSFFYINATYTGMIVIIFTIIILVTRNIEISAPTIYIGFLFGCTFTLTMFFYSMAMDTGPLSYSAFYFSVALVIPVLASILFWNEPIDLFKITGVVLLLIAFYLINVYGNEKDEGKFNRQWLIYCFLTFLFNGILPTLLKLHQTLLPSQEVIAFLLIGFGTSTLFSLVGVFVTVNKTKGQFSLVRLSMKSWLIIIILAISTAFANLLLTFLSGILPGVYLFPLVNGSLIVCLTIVSILIFKETISKGGIIGILIGVLAIVTVNF